MNDCNNVEREWCREEGAGHANLIIITALWSIIITFRSIWTINYPTRENSAPENWGQRPVFVIFVIFVGVSMPWIPEMRFQRFRFKCHSLSFQISMLKNSKIHIFVACFGLWGALNALVQKLSVDGINF